MRAAMRKVLNVDIPHPQRIRLNKIPVRVHVITHQRGKDLVPPQSGPNAIRCYNGP
jgi:hypothetical protein